MTETINPPPEAVLSQKEIDNKILAKKAGDMFIRVSMQGASSVVRQGAMIALECKKSNFIPKELKNVLIKDNEQVSRLIDAANRALIHAANKPVEEPEKPPNVPKELRKKDVVAIVKSDFKWAGRLTSLPTTDIENIRDYTPNTQLKRFISDETLTRLYATRLVIGQKLNQYRGPSLNR